MNRSPMPGCCGITVISGFSLISKEQLMEAEQEGRNRGYTVALATTSHKQLNGIEVLKERGWEELDKFTSRTTMNDITIWRKHLTREGVR